MFRPESMIELESAVIALDWGSNIRASSKPDGGLFFDLPRLSISATSATLLPGQKGAVFQAFSWIAIFFTKNIQSSRTSFTGNPVIFFTILPLHITTTR